MKLPRWLQHKQLEQELEEELNAHLNMDRQDRIARGESPRDADLNARRDFGNDLLIREATRRMCVIA